jgi:hypothetical protein
MIDLPWGSDDGDSENDGDGGDSGDDGGDANDGADSTPEHADAIVVCTFQDGTLAVYDDRVLIERVDRSRFEDGTIPAAEISGVDYDEGITIGYLQIERAGVEPDSGGLLSDPVNENTLHFGRGDRECARNARDAILSRAQA